MEATAIGSAAATPRRMILLVLVAASLATAPWSWAVDGPTPSLIVYPIVLLVGLWRMRRGGTLFVAIAAVLFFLVHLSWSWSAFTGERAAFLPEDIGVHRFEWVVTLFAVPLLTAIAGFTAWRGPARGIRNEKGQSRHGLGTVATTA